MPEDPKPQSAEYPVQPPENKAPITDQQWNEFVAQLPPPVSEARALHPPRRRASDFWALLGCNAIVFVASVCIMVVELTASRLIAAYLGSSLYTWTSVIGVVLAGISAGNYLGGWLADRHAPQKVLAWMFLISGLTTLLVLPLNTLAAANNTNRPEWMSWQAWVMTIVAAVFLIPAVALGTISPVTASMALKRSARTGITVGNIYAWGAVGSIVGTFLAGFWLIGAVGTRHIIWMTAAVLLVMGGIVAGAHRGLRMAILFGGLQLTLVVGMCAGVTEGQMARLVRFAAEGLSLWSTGDERFTRDYNLLDAAILARDTKAIEQIEAQIELRRQNKQFEDAWAAWGKELGRQLHELGLHLALRRDRIGEFNVESDYYAINIHEAEQEGDPVKVLRLDYLIHSYYNRVQPTKLDYDYERVYAAVTERAAEGWQRDTSVELAERALSGALRAALPERVRFDAATGHLSIAGAMSSSQAIQLLSIVPDVELWDAITQKWRLASRRWRQNTQWSQGRYLVPYAPVPGSAPLVEQGSQHVRFDGAGNLVFTAPFDLREAFDVLSRGEARAYVQSVRDLHERSRQTSTLFIGGGGFIFPRWIEAHFPHQPLIDVAEIDPAVKAAVEAELGLPSQFGPPAESKTWVRTHLGDARKFVDERTRENRALLAAGSRPVTYDFVYGDAFNDLSVPWHLTTLEFTRMIHELLTPGEGVYLVNIIDIYPREQYPRHSSGNRPAQGKLLKDPPPAALFPQVPSGEEWTRATGEFANLQCRPEGDDGFALAYRGVMSAALRDTLRHLAGGDEEFIQAVDHLYRWTNESRFGRFLGRYVNTVREVFPCVYVFTSNERSAEPGENRDTFIVACSLKPIDFANLEQSGEYWTNPPFAATERDPAQPGGRRDAGEMTALVELARGLQLTDDFAPVDNLLAPVFVSRAGEKD